MSDAHIRTDRSQRCRVLVDFLVRTGPRITDLYILGDLFEIWFEYGIVMPKGYFGLLAALRSLLDQGKKIHYVLGNHEIAVGRFFDDFGFVVHRGPVVVEVDGRSVLLAHGHGIDRRAWTTVWDHILRSKMNHRMYRLIHPGIGLRLAQQVAYLSRKQRPSEGLMKTLEDYARRQLSEVDVVILAHSHVPVFHEFPDNKYYINAGDWINHFSYVVIDGKRISLEYYDEGRAALS